MTILITGGAGFIGSEVTKQILRNDAGAEIVVLDNLHPQVHGTEATFRSESRVAEFVNADVTDSSAWDFVLDRHRPTTVIHLAAETGTGQSLRQASRHASVNVLGTATMTDAFARNDCFPHRMVLTSSRAVYGEGKWEDVDGQAFYPIGRGADQLESRDWLPKSSGRVARSPLAHDASSVEPRPTNVYAATKLAQEHVLNAWGLGFGVQIATLRLQNVYGAGQALNNPYTGVLTFLARQIVAGEDVEVFEGGGIVRDFVHVTDVARALTAAIDAPGVSPTPYDIGSGEPMTLLQVAKALVAAGGDKVKVKVTDRYREGDVRAAFADISRAVDELSYRPSVAFDQGAHGLLSWAAS